MPQKSSTSHPLLLGGTLLFGVFTLTLALFGLASGYGYKGFDFSSDGLSRFSRLIFDATALLGLQPMSPDEPNVWFSAARLFAVLFAGFAVIGLVLELYRPASDGALRMRFKVQSWRLWFWVPSWRREPAVVIGLGWIGGPLAKTLRENGRPVYGIALEEESPRAAEARRHNTLVVLGDATDPAVRARAGLSQASEVFIATGDDARNLDIAGELLRDVEEVHVGPWTRFVRWISGGIWPNPSKTKLGRRSSDDKLHCYVHVGDVSLSNALHDHELFKHTPEGIEFHFFSNQELASSDLFFGRTSVIASSDPGPVENRGLVWLPSSDEVFHLFVFGFGSMGQTVALHLARFGHFASGLRSRLTLFGLSGDRQEWNRFLERHPAFAPHDLDLSHRAFLQAGDSWGARPKIPVAPQYRTREVPIPDPSWTAVTPEEKVYIEEAIPLARSRRVQAIEYAVNAEFEELSAEVDSHRMIEKIQERIAPAQGPPVRAAIAICLEEDRKSFHAGLRLQTALARHFMREFPLSTRTNGSAETNLAATRIPIHVYLPVEAGLAEVFSRKSQETSRNQRRINSRFPVYAFGQQRAVTSYEGITGQQLRDRAQEIQRTYRTLSGIVEHHPHFELSDSDAARYEHVKCNALGIRFFPGPLSEAEAKKQGVHPEPLLSQLYPAADTVSAFTNSQEGLSPEFSNPSPAGRARTTAPAEKISFSTLTNLPRAHQKRLAVLDRVEYATSERWEEDTLEEEHIKALIEEAIEDFRKEVERKANRESLLAAKMEHNRWMGERLSKGWRFGPRDNIREQRESFVPFDRLTDRETWYDRKDLPNLVLERREEGIFAYIERRTTADEHPRTEADEPQEGSTPVVES